MEIAVASYKNRRKSPCEAFGFYFDIASRFSHEFHWPSGIVFDWVVLGMMQLVF
jgi:hypothetical protein